MLIFFFVYKGAKEIFFFCKKQHFVEKNIFFTSVEDIFTSYVHSDLQSEWMEYKDLQSAKKSD
jgi:hypothetical protein